MGSTPFYKSTTQRTTEKRQSSGDCLTDTKAGKLYLNPANGWIRASNASVKGELNEKNAKRGSKKLSDKLSQSNHDNW